MKIPQKPRPSTELITELLQDPKRLAQVMSRGRPSATVEGRYIHWDNLRHRSPPRGLTLEEWWARIKFARNATVERIPLTDASGEPFIVASPHVLRRLLHQADRDLSGRVKLPEQITTPGIRDRYQASALIEEAITSSQIEGAATTRKVARDMLRSGRQPRDTDERMIFNNFQAMEFVRSIRDKPLSPELVYRIHRIVTDGTLPDPSASGRLRTTAESGEKWGVYAPDDTLLHIPPPAEQLPRRLKECCKFANDDDPRHFIHPIVRSILLHFWIGYEHPFVDGNGRTARALFYWSMLRHGYWLAEFLSVSHVLHRAPVKYAQAYLYSETDDNDTTYFVIHQMEILLRSIEELLKYVRRKAAAVKETREMMKRSTLNHRQIALLTHALRNPQSEYTVTRHANSHRVTRQTARTDLRELAGVELLLESRRGRGFVFPVPRDLERRLKRFDEQSRAPSAPRRGPGRPRRMSNQTRRPAR